MKNFLLTIAALVVFTVAPANAQSSYTNQAALAVNPTFIERVELAAVSAALDVYNEAPGTTGHSARAAMARQVVESPDPWARVLAWGVAADVSISAATTDTALKSRIAAIWNTYAGV